MNFAMLQLNLVTGDICGNAARIAKAARAAAVSGADLCITPNHALCGVGPQHMLTADGFVEACQNALHALAKECMIARVSSISYKPPSNVVKAGE